MASAVELDSVSARFRLSTTFEYVVRDIRNWAIPNVVNVLDLLDPTLPALDLTDGVSQDDSL